MPKFEAPMELSPIYTATRLYKIAVPFEGLDKAPVSLPEGFAGVSVLYEYEPSAILPDDLAAFLARVIEGGMKLGASTVLTANLCYTDTSLQKLAEQLKSKVVIVFGLTWLSELKNARIRKNQVVSLYGMKVLFTDTLDIINTNDAAKKAFWVELKKVV
jgi:hypothetical protein